MSERASSISILANELSNRSKKASLITAGLSASLPASIPPFLPPSLFSRWMNSQWTVVNCSTRQHQACHCRPRFYGYISHDCHCPATIPTPHLLCHPPVPSHHYPSVPLPLPPSGPLMHESRSRCFCAAGRPGTPLCLHPVHLVCCLPGEMGYPRLAQNTTGYPRPQR